MSGFPPPTSSLQEQVFHPLVTAHRTRLIKLHSSACCNYPHMRARTHARPQFMFISDVVLRNHILQQIEIGRTG